MDVELREVRDFLAAHPPFSGLPAGTLDGLPPRLHLRYFRRGTVIVELGAPNNSLYVLRSGAVDILRDGVELVERAEVGACFGTSSVVSRQPSAYRITAIEDSLVLVMPGAVFGELTSADAGFAGFFGVTGTSQLAGAVAELASDVSGRIILKTRLGDLVKRTPVTAGPGISIGEAARVMSEHRVSALLLVDAGRLAGIITDRDLRNKVVAVGRSADDPVTSVMTPDPVTVGPDALAFEAMIEMVGRNVHHLPVVDGDALVGLVSSGDLMRLETANPVFLVGDIARQTSVDGLAALVRRLPALVTQLLGQDASATEIHRLLTAVGDATTRRLLQLAEAELGAPPVPYEWLALGSQGRFEHGLGSDQDHVLLLDDAAGPEDDAWFAELAERVASGLEACGYPRCPGGVMATNPRWRQSSAAWQRDFHGWLSEPDADAVLQAQIFFDFRPVHGGSVRADALRASITAAAPRASRFLGHLAAQAVERQPPIGFFRTFVLDRGGRAEATLDLKSGLHSVVELARVQALANGVAAVNTVERLRACAAVGAFTDENASALVDAFELVSYLRLRHQAQAAASGRRPDNDLAPDELSALEKKHLREAFGIIRRVQQGLTFRYQTHLMS